MGFIECFLILFTYHCLLCWQTCTIVLPLFRRIHCVLCTNDPTVQMIQQFCLSLETIKACHWLFYIQTKNLHDFVLSLLLFVDNVIKNIAYSQLI